MSTPTGKPFNPFDLSPYAPKRARDRADQESAETGEGESAVLLPYARRGNLRQVPLPDDPPPRVVAPLQEAPKESEAQAEPQAKVQPATEEEPTTQNVGADESISDADLQRLESSLRWLQREGSGSSGRLPRAVQLPPVAGIPAVDPDGTRARGDQFINGYRVPPSLAPERLRPPPPMRERRENLRGPLRIVLASVLAAPIAYYFSIGGLSRWSTPTSPAEPQLASVEQHPAAPTTMQVPKDSVRQTDPVRVADTQQPKPVVVQTIRPSRPDSNPTNASGQTGTQTASTQAAAQVTAPTNTSTATAPVDQPATSSTSTMVASNSPTGGANALPQPGLPVTAAPRAVKTVRQLDPEAVKLLMQQGEQFVASGDVVTARLVFQRAAEAGDATAALAMGATYDPIVLAKLGARGIVADVDKARSWYERAKEFGSPEAPKRIEMLANR